MEDSDCVSFLQEVLPGMHLRWQGFRKVRGQVCKRLQRRLNELQLKDGAAYKLFLYSHPQEWQVLDGLCRVTVSRFYRDKKVFAVLERDIFPQLLQLAGHYKKDALRLWSAGCGAGEEPYTLALLWEQVTKRHCPQLNMHILATDMEENLLQRARTACYPYSSIKNLPPLWRTMAFEPSGDKYCLHASYKKYVEFMRHDIRTPVINGPFCMILCRNLAFTYFDTVLQIEIAERLYHALHPGGVLVIGVHESLPEAFTGFAAHSARLGIYIRQQERSGA